MMSVWHRRAIWGIAVMLSLAGVSELITVADSAQQRGRPSMRMPGRRQRPGRPAQARPGPSAAPAAPAAPPGGAPTSPLSQPLEVVQSAGGTKMIRMEFYGLDIDHLLRLLSREAGVTIIKSEQVTGPITVIAPEPVPLDVAFQILNSVLEVRGFTMVRAPTGIYKVLSIADAVQSGPPMQFGARPEDVPTSDTFITQVIPLTTLSAGDVASQIQGLLSQNASLIPTSTNSLIITDTAASIQRALTLIAETESQLSGGLQVSPLRYYDAQDMTDLVNSLVLGRGGGAGGGAAAPARTGLPYERRLTQRAPVAARAAGGAAGGAGPEFCYPDLRTNSLIVLAIPIHLQQIEVLVDQLDRPINLRDTFFVYPVQNLVASDLAQKVGPLFGAQVAAGAAAPGGAVAAPSARTRSGISGYGTPATGATRGGGRVTGAALPAGGRPVQMAALPAAPGRGPEGASRVEVEPLAGTAPGHAAANPVTVAQVPEGVLPLPPQPLGPLVEVAPAPGAEEGAAVPMGGTRETMITADDNTNTLLIAASPEQLELIKQLLEKLDVAPAQVSIQAIIAEVTLTRDTSLGFQWQDLGRTFGTFQGNTYTGDLSSNFGVGTLAKDSAGNVTGPTGFFGQISGGEFRAMLKALTTDSHARILSTPSIFTSNNQPAQIDVSSSRPFPRGSLTTTVGTGAAISTSIDYQSVGIVLSVTPRVTQGNVVQMTVSVSADEPGASVNIAGQEYPSVARRQTNATLSVKDGYTIVLGGLMRDTITRSASKVPLLGDIPLIGSLFRSTTSHREKSELLVFLTPRVVRSPAEAAALTESEKQKLGDVPRTLRTPSAPVEQEKK